MPLSNREHVPLLVTGIHDNGEIVSTEQDPVDVDDMLPDDVKNLVNLLEGYIDKIAKGTVTARHYFRLTKKQGLEAFKEYLHLVLEQMLPDVEHLEATLTLYKIPELETT